MQTCCWAAGTRYELPSVVQNSAMPLGSAYGTPGPPFEYRYAGPDDEPWSPVTI